MQWYLFAFRKYINFAGRARRKEYFYFLLFTFLTSFVLAFIDEFINIKFEYAPKQYIGILSIAYNLFILIPSLGVSVRRLHDSGKSGWWMLIYTAVAILYIIASRLFKNFTMLMIVISIIFIIFSFYYIYLFFRNSEDGTNEYGANPKDQEVSYFSNT